MLDPWRPGLVPAGRRRPGRRGRAALVRAAPPPDGAGVAGRRRAGLARRPGRGAGRVRARRLVPGGLAGAGRGARRAGRRRSRPSRVVRRSPRWSAGPSPSWCWRRPSRCSSRRSACAPAPRRRSSRRCCSSRCCPAFELLFPDRGEPGAVAADRRSCRSTAVVAGRRLRRRSGCPSTGSTPTHPVPSQLVYALDTDAGQAWWASTEDDPGTYTARYVEGRATAAGRLPVPRRRRRADRARPSRPTCPRRRSRSSPTTVVGDAPRVHRAVTPQRPGVRLVTLEVAVDGGTVVAGPGRRPRRAGGGARARTGCW